MTCQVEYTSVLTPITYLSSNTSCKVETARYLGLSRKILTLKELTARPRKKASAIKNTDAYGSCSRAALALAWHFERY